jgi:hypothetical protein
MNRYFLFNEPQLSLNNTGPFHSVRHIHQFGTPNECPYFIELDSRGQMQIKRHKLWSNLANSDLEKLDCISNSTDCDVKRKTMMSLTKEAEGRVSALPFVHEYCSKTKISGIEKAATQEWRYTLEAQTKAHATKDGFVLLTAVNYDYREHLLNFKCTLEKVGMQDHFIVAALDRKVYKWGVYLGLPIFLAKSAHSQDEDSLVITGGQYGNAAFKHITKMKSLTVLEVLKTGYSVVWSDVDITWFYHPFDVLADYMKHDKGITIQSNAPFVQFEGKLAVPHETVNAIDHTESPASFRRLNSGLYVAPSNPLVIEAIEEIVEHASKSKMSEQPSFDLILCERFPSQRHYASCTYSPKQSKDKHGYESQTLHIKTLDRFHYPTGAVLVGPNNDNVYTLGLDQFQEATGKNLYAAHNNWISGEKLKKDRLVSAGWWFIDTKSQNCLFD